MAKDKVYYLLWIDSQSDNGWIPYKERKYYHPMIVETIGFIIHENKKLIRIALNIAKNTDGSNKQFCQTMIIPKVAILKRKRLI